MIEIVGTIRGRVRDYVRFVFRPVILTGSLEDDIRQYMEYRKPVKQNYPPSRSKSWIEPDLGVDPGTGDHYRARQSDRYRMPD